ncbi:hypothetical protein G4Y79_20850 [Phototrophicus methaneseepsis]|uniref:Uncharacterized protein n=1 Tax=Phototrophicus methaneseepsis TaxID=2710758 RepID=A0A7S8E843_9CHLR|nr:hypothetical protein [Phototrophicus methaneseepsis]QPC82106.1 hypothetical protein G4Y79_20850 [Phototrophicus methaneseepsis]
MSVKIMKKKGQFAAFETDEKGRVVKQISEWGSKADALAHKSANVQTDPTTPEETTPPADESDAGDDSDEPDQPKRRSRKSSS